MKKDLFRTVPDSIHVRIFSPSLHFRMPYQLPLWRECNTPDNPSGQPFVGFVRTAIGDFAHTCQINYVSKCMRGEAAMVRSSGDRVLIVDDRGNVWDDVAMLCAQVARHTDRQGTINFLINSMGFVALTISDRRIRIHLRPSNVAGTTLVSVNFILGDRPGMQCSAAVHGENGTRSDVILPRSEQCAEALEGLVLRAREVRFEVLSSRRLGPTDLVHIPPLRAALDYWTNWASVHSDSAFNRLLTDDLGGRFVVFNRNRQGGALRISQVGQGLPVFAVRTLGSLQGQKSGLIHPDPAYSQACASAYFEVLDRWKPLIEEVEAKAFWPQFGRLRRRYTRLILPLRTRDTVGVLSATTPCGRGSAFERAVG